MRWLLAVLVTLAVLPAPAGARGFSSGVASAEVTSRAATVWTRADRAGRVTLEVTRNGRSVARRRLRAAKRTDNTVQVRLRGLRPGTRYHFRFRRSRARSERGSFKTAPRPGSKRPVDFAWTGDSDPVKTGGRLLNAPFAVFSRMRREGNDFNVNLGDTIYSDTDSPLERTDPLAISLAEKRRKYRDMLSAPSLRRLRAAGGMYNQWDDHEFLNDFAIDQTRYPTRQGTAEGAPPRIVAIDGDKLYRDGARAFREYMPVTYSKADGIYRSVRWGRNLELFFLDERSFRDAGADDAGTCDNPPGSGQRDFAPTAPQRLRTVFSALIPQLATPPPPGCLERIRDPHRTYLGARQLARFTRAIDRSTATFKVVMNELPIQQFYADPYDRWEGYEAERLKLIRFLRTHVRNVVFLTADVHANLVNDVRLRTLEDPGPLDSGILEVTSGPSGTDSLADDLNDEVGNPQAAALANNAFLRQPPPNGPGIRCSNIDVFSYGQVKVTSRRLTIALRDEKGRTVKDPDGKACGPYVLDRR